MIDAPVWGGSFMVMGYGCSLVCRLYDAVDRWREFTEGQGWEELKTDRGATKNFGAPGKIWHQPPSNLDESLFLEATQVC